MSEPLRLLDLFSGIGGFSLGLERAGFKTVAFCEISAPCRHLLNHHWPAVPCYDDIKTLTAERLAADGITVDAICGGFPCQDLSFAGKGAGLDGARSGLWSEYARLICELRPRVVFVENVSALLSRGLGRVLGDLAALGYDAWWDCIPAGWLGAPHERDRLWIIAYPPDKSRVHEPNFAEAAKRLRDHGNTWLSSPWNETNPRICRMEDGVPNRVHRTSALGNAVVPPLVEILGRAYLATLA